MLEAVPMVRTAYESALTAAWCVHVPDAPIAIVNKHVVEHGKFMATLNRSRSLSHLAADIKSEALIETDSRDSAESFKRVCDDLDPGGDDAYSHYRLLCSMTPPGAFLSDFYVWPKTTQRALCCGAIRSNRTP